MKIGLIGATNELKKISGGQEIRTRILWDALRAEYGKEVVFVNTKQIRSKPFAVAWQMIKMLWQCQDVILIVSTNGRRVLIPFLAMMSCIAKKRIYHNAIGGYVAEHFKNHPMYISWMNRFVVNWVQLPSLAADLEKQGLKNAEVLPNSKPLSILSVPESKQVILSSPLRFCTFSRISKAKGIWLAVEAIEKINQQAGHTVATLDIYGPVDKDSKEAFSQLMSAHATSPVISYKGVVDYQKTTKILKNYFMLLFPTTYLGEGFPGTVLDAYAAGLPVLASDWKYNAELVQQGKQGLLYPYGQPEKFTEQLTWAVHHPEEVYVMRSACLYEAHKYTPEKVMPIIFNKINVQRKKCKK